MECFLQTLQTLRPHERPSKTRASGMQHGASMEHQGDEECWTASRFHERWEAKACELSRQLASKAAPIGCPAIKRHALGKGGS